MDKIRKNSIYGEFNTYADELVLINTKMEMYRKDDLKLIKSNLKAVLEASTVDYYASHRYLHSLEVARISEMLARDLAFTVNPFPMTGNAYGSVLDTAELDIVKNVVNMDSIWLFRMLGLMHDMYKYNETGKVEHGKIASKQFVLYCKVCGVDIRSLALQMKEALLYHSNKGMTIRPNPFFAILCDADILAHVTSFTVEKCHKYENMTEDQAYKKVVGKATNYVPKTNKAIYNNILQEQLNNLDLSMQRKRWLD